MRKDIRENKVPLKNIFPFRLSIFLILVVLFIPNKQGFSQEFSKEEKKKSRRQNASKR